MRSAAVFICVLIGVQLWWMASLAHAEEVGTVASVRGTAEIVRGRVATPAAVGMAVELGDQLRTGDGELRVVFRDDSVIDLGENASLTVDQQVFDPGSGRFSSLVKLLQGKARALVGSYYGTPGSSYEVETPTAVAGVRGTSFMVAYDPDADATQVVGIRGQIEVRGLGERANERVYVTAQEATTVLRGAGPTEPQPFDERLLQRDIEGLQLLALGGVGGAAATLSVRPGASVPAPDRAPSSTGMTGQLGRDQMRNPGDVVGQPLEADNATRGSLGVPF